MTDFVVWSARSSDNSDGCDRRASKDANVSAAFVAWEIVNKDHLMKLEHLLCLPLHPQLPSLALIAAKSP